MKYAKLIVWVVVMLLLISGSFFGGMKYGQTKKPSGVPGFAKGQGGLGRANNTRGGSMTNGEIISQDDKSVTVKTQDGSSKVIYFSDSTKITKSTTGSTSDLKSGAQVIVSGSSNTDNSVTATDIQIR